MKSTKILPLTTTLSLKDKLEYVGNSVGYLFKHNVGIGVLETDERAVKLIENIVFIYNDYIDGVITAECAEILIYDNLEELIHCHMCPIVRKTIFECLETLD